MMMGNLFSASAVSLGVVTASSAMSTEVIGVGDFTTSVMVREPVTVMTPNFAGPPSCLALRGGLASCDQVAPEPSAADTASAIKDTCRIFRVFITPPISLCASSAFVDSARR